MKVIFYLIKSLFLIFFQSLKLCYNVFVFVINVVDGGDDEDYGDTYSNKGINYNRRTGEIDPDKRIDGLYDDDHLKY